MAGNFRERNPAKNSGKTEEGEDWNTIKRLSVIKTNESMDEKFGYEQFTDGIEREAWLVNFEASEIVDEDKRLVSAISYYFILSDGNRLKCSLPYAPYFFIITKEGSETEVSAYLAKKYAGLLASVEIVIKEDLDLPNHLMGLTRKLIKLSFLNTNHMSKLKSALMPIVRKNQEKAKSQDAYTALLSDVLSNQDSVACNGHGSSNAAMGNKKAADKTMEQSENILDLREYDVPFHVRVAIDLNIFVGKWYNVKQVAGKMPEINPHTTLIDWPDPVVLAFDIETTKLPLKFPDSAIDQIMMISYMVDGQGYLIVNREIVSEDVEDFEYTPKPEFEGPFIIFNVPDEQALLQHFFDHIREVRPHVFATYNGDFFDWPFIERRATEYGLDMQHEIGFAKDSQGEYKSRNAIHMDCLCWVKRDSYLPVGSQNLKACTKAKLRYDPVELDPEEMCQMAREKPQILANYSVSDAVATYYLYMKYVHPFIFALSTIIPMKPDEVLRKGSGTLCEALLMVKAFEINILFPNKQITELNKMTASGQVLDNETYVGGHVEALESGVFRSNIPVKFRMVPEAFQKLISTLDSTLQHALVDEENIPLENVTNYEEIKTRIRKKLEVLRDFPSRMENPMIYHLDVGAMYPNIILTNRLQPPALVDETICATCDFNKPGAKCQRKMAWVWRGDIMPASRNEFYKVQYQLETEKFPPLFPGGAQRAYHELTREERAAAEKKRLGEYCRKAYKKTKVTKEEVRYSTICQRENSFYVDTVRAFRDRRYEFKGLTKVWKKKLTEALASGDMEAIRSAKSKEILYDSLQLAHKCILNSFYGYVMRKGSRWFSMEMAGIVCHTGANIIKQARELVEQIGRPLELDTDGIWCILPASFPENCVFTTNDPKKPSVTVSYPGAMLNVLVQKNFTNNQYHDRVAPDIPEYTIRSENSIFFEVDGPYLAMILPASKEEGKKLKKRYVVFNDDGSVAELKGFEVKRRGELQLIKNFQSSVFDAFLNGTTLDDAYEHAAKVANYWLDVLYSRAANMPDSELFDLIAENRFMSKSLSEYEGQKSTSISTAKRLAEFLGDQMVKEAGLACKFVISRKPENAPVTERAVPLAIFQSDPAVRSFYLKKWLKSPGLNEFDIREVLDWEYYIERFSSCIQKIITIPAALQGLSNPVPRVAHPDWLQKRLIEKLDYNKQKRISEIFMPSIHGTDSINGSSGSKISGGVKDIENLAGNGKVPAPVIRVSKKRKLELENLEALKKPWREVLGNPPDMGSTKESLQAWIQFHKKKWAHQIKQRKNRELVEKTSKRQKAADDVVSTSNNSNARGPTLNGGLNNFVRKTQTNLMNTHWQIIQISKTASPGLFKAWTLVGQDLHCLKISVPRIFYINMKQPKEQERGHIWKRTQKYLPRAHPTFNLYQYCVPEQNFIEHAAELQVDFTSPNVEGVYELSVPLEFRFLVNIGCVCVINKHIVKTLIGRDTEYFDMQELTEKTLADVSYLEEENVTLLRKLFLYQFLVSGRGVTALFGTHMPKAYLFIIDPSGTNSIPNLNSMYATEWNLKKNKEDGANSSMIPPGGLTFESTVCKDPEVVNKALTKILQNYKSEKRGPTIVCYQANSFKLFNKITVLHNDFPTIDLTVEDPPNLLSGLEWQKMACRWSIKHYLNFLLRYNSLVDHCRYLHIPIGNMPGDDVFNFGADLFYARQLRKHNHLMWLSKTDRPDFGGKEADDHRLASNAFDSHRSVEVIDSGLFKGVCVEIEICSLPIATIVQSHHVNDMEGGAADSISFNLLPQQSIEEMISSNSGSDQSLSVASYDSSVLCTYAFRVMKSMVHSWLKEVSVYRNPWADLQLVHLYRWLTSPSAYLHDPALTKIVAMMMQKVLIQLVAEFKRLGADIIYASFNKLIINTTKHSIEDAHTYINFITENIRSRDLFHILDFKPNKFWNILMFMDSCNFGGIICTQSESKENEAPEAVANQHSVADVTEKETETVLGNEITEIDDVDENHSALTNQSDKNGDKLANRSEVNVGEVANQSTEKSSNSTNVESEPDNNLEIDANWNLMYYLPIEDDLQQQFTLIMANYLVLVLKKIEQLRADGTMATETVIVEGAEGKEVMSSFESNLREFCRRLISNDITQKIVGVVHGLQMKRQKFEFNEVQNEDKFPVLPGSFLKFKNPELEFIKSLCHVLSLDSSVTMQVEQMKKTVLRIINVGEFSDVADFQNPSLSFILREVICKECNYCRDVDLCRDVTLDFEGEDLGSWKCTECSLSYDLDEIEMSLVSEVQKLSLAFVLQDLSCVKCKNIKQLNMKRTCECSGNFTYLMKKDKFSQQLMTLWNIAKYYKMEYLRETVQWTRGSKLK